MKKFKVDGQPVLVTLIHALKSDDVNVGQKIIIRSNDGRYGPVVRTVAKITESSDASVNIML